LDRARAISKRLSTSSSHRRRRATRTRCSRVEMFLELCIESSNVRLPTSLQMVSRCRRASRGTCRRVRPPTQAFLCGTTIVRSRTKTKRISDSARFSRSPGAKSGESLMDARSAALDAVRAHMQDRANILRIQRTLGERNNPAAFYLPYLSAERCCPSGASQPLSLQRARACQPKGNRYAQQLEHYIAYCTAVEAPPFPVTASFVALFLAECVGVRDDFIAMCERVRLATLDSLGRFSTSSSLVRGSQERPAHREPEERVGRGEAAS
jgi:hypothetical protein